jgi:hypothetical protein
VEEEVRDGIMQQVRLPDKVARLAVDGNCDLASFSAVERGSIEVSKDVERLADARGEFRERGLRVGK